MSLEPGSVPGVRDVDSRAGSSPGVDPAALTLNEKTIRLTKVTFSDSTNFVRKVSFWCFEKKMCVQHLR